MHETMKDAIKLADQISSKYKPEVLRIAQLVVTAARLCPLMGHNMHEAMNECALAYCEVNQIDVDEVNACIGEIETAERTLAELAKLEAGDLASSQGVSVGTDFFNRFKRH